MDKSYIFAETAFHHEGDLGYMYQLIDAASEAGADGIKFQVLINFSQLISKYHPAFEQLKNYVFTSDTWASIFERAISKSLDIIVMPLDVESFKLIDNYKQTIKYLELHSVSYNDTEVKEKLRQSGIDIILSVGGRTKDELESAYKYFGDSLRVLMTGFQSFPSNINDIKLSRITVLKQQFPQMKIGYADHSRFDDPWSVQSNMIAYTLGATIFEKHLAINEGQKRVDFESAVGIGRFKQIKVILDSLYDILYAYSDPFEMSPSENSYRNRQKMVVARGNLPEGSVLSIYDVNLKMIGRFDGFSRIQDVIGKTLVKPVSEDEIIMLNHVIN